MGGRLTERERVARQILDKQLHDDRWMSEWVALLAEWTESKDDGRRTDSGPSR